MKRWQPSAAGTRRLQPRTTTCGRRGEWCSPGSRGAACGWQSSIAPGSSSAELIEAAFHGAVEARQHIGQQRHALIEFRLAFELQRLLESRGEVFDLARADQARATVQRMQ